MNAEQERITKLAVELTKQLSLIPEGALSATLPKEMLLIIALVCSYVEKTSLRSDTQLAYEPDLVPAPERFGDLAVGDVVSTATGRDPYTVVRNDKHGVVLLRNGGTSTMFFTGHTLLAYYSVLPGGQ
jgi:hypothetical protein